MRSIRQLVARPASMRSIASRWSRDAEHEFAA
jgi:hypothetical protein